MLELNDEIFSIAKDYRKKVISREVNDSIHLAVAAYYNLDAVVSWNVNLKTIKVIHAINLNKGLNSVEIVTVENLGGDKYGTL